MHRKMRSKENMRVDTFEISERFCGPPRSGNGGYVCGRIAQRLTGAATVRLKMPPPLNALLRLESTDAQAHLFHDNALVGQAHCIELDLHVPPSPSFEVAVQASRGYSGFTNHVFPGCFVCGPQRKPFDGLRIFPGPVNGSTVLAATWQPDASLADEDGHIKPEILWSVLDCTGAFAVMPLAEGVAIVLGELSAELLAPLSVDARCVVLGWSLGVQGRKRHAGTAVVAEDGRLIAKARAVWIEVPSSTWAADAA